MTDPELPPTEPRLSTTHPASDKLGSTPSEKSYGKYALLGELGRGGMGVVYRARDSLIQREVALKLLGADADAELIARFEREAKNLAQLQHPHIVGLHEFGEVDGSYYLAMELVDGISLAEHLDQHRVDPQDAARLLKPIAEALSYAHERGIIHRDVKPANIMLDRSGQPQLLDFGLARKTLVDTSLTQTGQLLGTPHYMAPEQARGDGKSVGPHTDIYALGAVLYELLTLQTPFVEEDVILLLQRVQRDEPTPPRRLNSRIHINLETICLKAMAKVPARRYETAGAMASDLGRFLAGDSISARPPSLGYRLARFLRRRWKPIATIVALLLSIVGTLYTTQVAYPQWQARKEQRQAAEARQRRQQALDQAHAEARTALDADRPDACIERAKQALKRHPGHRPPPGQPDLLARLRVLLSRAYLASASGDRARVSRRLALAYHHAPNSLSGQQALLRAATGLVAQRSYPRARRLLARLTRGPLRGPAGMELCRIAMFEGDTREARRLLVDLLAQTDLAPDVAAQAQQMDRQLRLVTPMPRVPFAEFQQADYCHVILTDLDGDQRDDVVSINRKGLLSALRYNLKSGKFEPILRIQLTRIDRLYGARIAAGDLDGDGKPELIVGIGDPSKQICELRLIKQVRPGRWDFRPMKWTGPKAFAEDVRGSIFWDLEIRDLTGDGRADLLIGQGWYNYRSGVGVQQPDGSLRYVTFPAASDDGKVGLRTYCVMPARAGPPTLLLALEDARRLIACRWNPKTRAFDILAKLLDFEGHGLTRAGDRIIVMGSPGLGKPNRLRELTVGPDRLLLGRLLAQLPGRQRQLQGHTLLTLAGQAGQPIVAAALTHQTPGERSISRTALLARDSQMQPLALLDDSHLMARGDLDGDGDDELLVQWEGEVRALGLGTRPALENLPQGRLEKHHPRRSAAAVELQIARDLLTMREFAQARTRLEQIISTYPDSLGAGMARIELARCTWGQGQVGPAIEILRQVELQTPSLSAVALRLAYEIQLDSGSWAAALRAGRRLGTLGALAPKAQRVLNLQIKDLASFEKPRSALIGFLDPKTYGIPASSPFVLQGTDQGWRYTGAGGTQGHAGIPLRYVRGSFEIRLELTFEQLGWDTPFAVGLYRTPGLWQSKAIEHEPRLLWKIKTGRGQLFINRLVECWAGGTRKYQTFRRMLDRKQRYQLTMRYLQPTQRAVFELSLIGHPRPFWRTQLEMNFNLPGGLYTLGVANPGGSFNRRRYNRIRIHSIQLLAGTGVFLASGQNDTFRMGNALMAIGRYGFASQLFAARSRNNLKAIPRVQRDFYWACLLHARKKYDAARKVLEKLIQPDPKLLGDRIALEARNLPPALFDFLIAWQAGRHPLRANTPALILRKTALQRKPDLASKWELLVLLKLLGQKFGGLPSVANELLRRRLDALDQLGLWQRSVALRFKRLAQRPNERKLQEDLLHTLVLANRPVAARKLAAQLLDDKPSWQVVQDLILLYCEESDPVGLRALLGKMKEAKFKLVHDYPHYEKLCRRYEKLLAQERRRYPD